MRCVLICAIGFTGLGLQSFRGRERQVERQAASFARSKKYSSQPILSKPRSSAPCYSRMLMTPAHRPAAAPSRLYE